MPTPRNTLLAMVTAVVMTACAGSKEADPDDSHDPSPSIDIPSDVELTDAGSKLSSDEPATVVWDSGANAVSAITVKLKDVKKGKTKDFRFFSLEDEQKKATPYYVRIKVTNEGPAGLGGRVPPVQLLTGDDKKWLPNPVNGELKQCDPRKLPKSFLPGSDTDMCLVYFVESDAKAKRVALQGEPHVEAVHWSASS